jgi:hypothetical protein
VLLLTLGGSIEAVHITVVAAVFFLTGFAGFHLWQQIGGQG